jgi:hypothetical protein
MCTGRTFLSPRLLISKFTIKSASEPTKEPLNFCNYYAKTTTLMAKISSEIRRMILKAVTLSKQLQSRFEIFSSF